MKDLIDLVELITQQKVSQIDIITKDTKMSGHTKKLLEGIRSGKIRNDENGMLELYGSLRQEPYKKIKQRLKKRLLNTLFFIDQNKSFKQDGVSSRYYVYRQYSTIMILYSKGKRDLANRLAIRLLHRAEKLKMNDIIFLLSNSLQENYLVWSPNEKNAESFFQKAEKALEIQRNHTKITEIWATLAKSIMSNRSSKADLELYKIEEELYLLQKELKIQDDFLSLNRYYSSRVFLYWIREDYLHQKAVCNEALDYLELYRTLYPVPFVTMITYKAIAELNLREYEQCENTLTNCLAEFKMTPGRLHWLNVYNYLFLVKMIQKKYTEGAYLLSEVTSLRNFKKIDEKWRQPWLIKEAYINILLSIGKINDDQRVDLNLRPFRINRFMNEVPLFSKDKMGTNIAILTAQFIFLLAEDKTNRLIERLDALNQYCHRYLRNDHTYRSNCFIKLLMKIPLADFHPVRVRNHSKALWKKLQNAPLKISEQSYEVEIIPYEDLWDLVLEILDSRKS